MLTDRTPPLPALQGVHLAFACRSRPDLDGPSANWQLATCEALQSAAVLHRPRETGACVHADACARAAAALACCCSVYRCFLVRMLPHSLIAALLPLLPASVRRRCGSKHPVAPAAARPPRQVARSADPSAAADRPWPGAGRAPCVAARALRGAARWAGKVVPHHTVAALHGLCMSARLHVLLLPSCPPPPYQHALPPQTPAGMPSAADGGLNGEPAAALGDAAAQMARLLFVSCAGSLVVLALTLRMRLT